MTRTMMAAVASILLCGPALGGDAATDHIGAMLLATPVWVYEWGHLPGTPTPAKFGSGQVTFVEKDGKLIGVLVVDVDLKCSNEVRLRADGFDFENCRGSDYLYVRSGNEFKNTDGRWYHTFRPAP
jgi:hypothetical protein